MIILKSFVCGFASERWGEAEPLSGAAASSLGRGWGLQLRPAAGPGVGSLHVYMAGWFGLWEVSVLDLAFGEKGRGCACNFWGRTKGDSGTIFEWN